MGKDDEKKVFDLPEAAHFLNISEITLLQAAQRGEIVATKSYRLIRKNKEQNCIFFIRIDLEIFAEQKHIALAKPWWHIALQGACKEYNIRILPSSDSRRFFLNDKRVTIAANHSEYVSPQRSFGIPASGIPAGEYLIGIIREPRIFFIFPGPLSHKKQLTISVSILPTPSRWEQYRNNWRPFLLKGVV